MITKKTILSLEQALALPYATQRFVQLGWRVIRIESPAEGDENAGDPNRYIGADLGYHDLHSYYIAPNAGKEAITINLKKKEGQELLKKIIRELKVDVFMCNTLPKRYQQLGIDFKTLRDANPHLIWCGISAMGPQYPDRAGYDPALQALMGFTYLTGEPEGKPVPSGIPIIDLKAGDEAFTQVLLAMLKQKDLSPSNSPMERRESPGYHTTDSQRWNLLQDKAVEMRQNPTKAEKILWESLRRNATNYHFRRQHIIDRFIVDFVCLKKGLVVEVDGDIHDFRKEEDELRTKILNENYVKVIRFKNERVIADVDAVVSEIVSVLNSLPDNNIGRDNVLPSGDDTGGVKVLPSGDDTGGVKVLPSGEDTGGVKVLPSGEDSGGVIHISMAQCAASWLITALPQLNFVQSDEELFSRSGNEHRSFIPCNAYPTKDGFIYLAIGNDSQWTKFTLVKGFESLAKHARKTNEGRMKDKENIYDEIGALTKNYTTQEFYDLCLALNLSVAPVNSIKEVAQLKFVNNALINTWLPNGKVAKLSPASHNTEFLENNKFTLSCSPRLGEQNEKILTEIGYTKAEIINLKNQNII